MPAAVIQSSTLEFGAKFTAQGKHCKNGCCFWLSFVSSEEDKSELCVCNFYNISCFPFATLFTASYSFGKINLSNKIQRKVVSASLSLFFFLSLSFLSLTHSLPRLIITHFLTFDHFSILFFLSLLSDQFYVMEVLFFSLKHSCQFHLLDQTFLVSLSFSLTLTITLSCSLSPTF